MPPDLAKSWLSYRSNERLREALDTARLRLRDAHGQEDAARQALADWKCGAAHEDLTLLVSLMSTLGAALQSQGLASKAERVQRDTVDFVERRLSNREDLLATALTELAGSLEARSAYDEARILRTRALALNLRSNPPKANSIKRDETNLDLLIALKTNVDEMLNVGQVGAAESAARYFLNEADQRSQPDDYVTAVILLKLASVLDSERKYVAAEAFLHRLIAISGTADPRLFNVIWQAQSVEITNLTSQERFEEAYSKAMSHLAAADRSGDVEHRIAANQQMADLYIAQYKWSQAEPYLRSAVKMTEKFTVSEDWYCLLAYTLSVVVRHEGQFREAESLLHEVIARDSRRAGIVGGKLPKELFGDKNTQAIYKWGASAAPFTDYAKDLTAMAASIEGQGRYAEARALTEQALKINARQLELENAFDPDVHANDVRVSREFAARFLVSALWEIDARNSEIAKTAAATSLDEAFEAAQLITNSAAGAALVRAGAKALAARKGLSGYLRSRDALQAQLTELDAQDLKTSAQIDSKGFESHLQAHKELQSIAAELYANSQKLRSTFPDYWNLIDPGPVSIAELQGAKHGQAPLLKTDEAMVLVLQDSQGVYVYAVSVEDAAWYKASLTSDALNALVSQIRCTVDPDRCQASMGVAPFDRGTAYNLYKALLGDSGVSRIVSAHQKILLIANGALTSLPLDLLVTERPAGRDSDPQALRETHWLIKEKTISILPSVASLRSLRRLMAASTDVTREPFLGFAPRFQDDPHDGRRRGVPEASQSYYQDERALVDQIRALANLSNDREIDAVRVALGANPDTMFKGEHARKIHVLELDRVGRLGRARVLEFATHALTSGQFSGLGEPALVLSPPPASTIGYSESDNGLLTASDVESLHLNADWVILSACNTGAGQTPEAEGLSGLARAFLFAGANSLLVSHWSVDDEAALALVTRTFAFQKENPKLTRAGALRLAELELMTNTARDDHVKFPYSFANPIMWAPFVVIAAD